MDELTILRAVDGHRLTKRITQDAEGNWTVEPYGSANWFSVETVALSNIIDLGFALERLQGDPSAGVIRAQPLPGIDTTRCRQLLYPKDEAPATFEPAPRQWLACDFDHVPTPVWDPNALEKRRRAIAADRRVEAVPAHLAGDSAEIFNWGDRDQDPAPIAPVADHELVVGAAIATLPREFSRSTSWWQMTSSAGIKPGIRIRTWHWLSHPITDADAKRWLSASPVDLALFSPVQLHYVAAPIFDPPELDPVPLRCGFYWGRQNVVEVPDLRPSVPPRPPGTRRAFATPPNRARERFDAYALACLNAVEAAPPGDRYTKMRSVAVTLMTMAERGLIDGARAKQDLRHIGSDWPTDRLEALLDWCEARAQTAELPEALR